MAPLLAMRGIDKRFAGIPALRAAVARGGARRGSCADRPERRRQVDHDQDPDRLSTPRTPARSCSTARRSTFASPQEAQSGRDQHDLPGDQPRPLPLGDREHLPRPRAAPLRPARLGPPCTRGRRAPAPLRRRRSTCIARSWTSTPPSSRWSPSPARSSFEAKLVIMDEPTSSLDEREVAVLFDVIRQLKRERRVGDLRQPQARRALCGLRPGHDHARRPHRAGAPDDRDDQARSGRGHAGPRARPGPCGGRHGIARAIASAIGRELFCRLDHLAGRAQGARRQLEVGSGEIVGLAGLLGSGRTETARAVFGADRPDAGTITLRRRARTQFAEPARTPSPPAWASARRTARSRASSPTCRCARTSRWRCCRSWRARGIVDEARSARSSTGSSSASASSCSGPGAEDPRALGRQPAEGAARALALHEPASC